MSERKIMLSGEVQSNQQDNSSASDNMQYVNLWQTCQYDALADYIWPSDLLAAAQADNTPQSPSTQSDLSTHHASPICPTQPDSTPLPGAAREGEK